MAVALPPTPRSIGFPHNILHDTSDFQPSRSMDQSYAQKPSLPSISSLIEAVKDQPQNGLDRSPISDHPRKLSGASSGHPTSPARSAAMGSPRSHPPPTPPLPGPASFDFHPRHSSGNTSPASTHASHQGYYNHNLASIAASTNPEHYAQQPRSSYPPIPEPGQWAPTPSSARSPTESSQTDSVRKLSYPEPPSSATSITSSTHLENGNSHQYPIHSSTLAQQRPLPSTFPPVPGQASMPPIDPQMTPTTPSQQGHSPVSGAAPATAPQPPSIQAAAAWQHHHYYPPTSSSPYPPPADRYVCPTCQKPFSRPSSLKIHTYSHTGEKPFKCKHDGCGKFFSVRSNMKRHEKGCHGGDSGSNCGSPKA